MLGRASHASMRAALLVSTTALAVLVCCSPRAFSAVRTLGPKQNLASAVDDLRPGDVLQIPAGMTLPPVTITRSGSPTQPITIRGLVSSGRRPVLRGGPITLRIKADHIVIEGLEISHGDSRCIFTEGNDITIRDSVVHHCPLHGILAADDNSGSLTLERVEVYASGSGDHYHPVYVATDEKAFPGSVFRMQNCYLHDNLGGNNVKSRAERNLIVGNWIEGALYHELELIGPDSNDPHLVREDSDVVGNVFRKLNDAYMVRIGGDGTGETMGRYRFVNNTFVMAAHSTRAILRVFDGVEELELVNNVFYRQGGGPVELLRDVEARWVSGKRSVRGSNNWLPLHSQKVPASLSATIQGRDPGFVHPAQLDFRPAAGSPLIDAGLDPATIKGVGELWPEVTVPARRASPPSVRRTLRKVDIGALEATTTAQAAPTSSMTPTRAQACCRSCQVGHGRSEMTGVIGAGCAVAMYGMRRLRRQ